MEFKFSKTMHHWKNDLLHLVYPESCLICENELSLKSVHICSFCESELKLTYFENYSEPSSLDKLFWGRLKLTSTCALLNFEKDSSTQIILHSIKYKNKQKLAIAMGEMFGEKLIVNTEKYGCIDALIPVPLHPKKRFKRGYNQSELIANGLSKSIGKPVILDFLSKGVHTKSQTTKSRFMRWDNVSEVFEINVEKLNGINHIAIVDDVVTTGSTLEACVQKIQILLPDLKVSILSLAITK